MSTVQIITALAFWLFFFASLAIVSISGGQTGKKFTLLLVAAVGATFIANWMLGSKSAQIIVLGIDLGLLALVTILALYKSRYWPLWFSGFHSISVATGIAHLAFPVGIPEIYIDASGFWALPALGAAAAGVLLDRRANLAV